MFVSPVAGKIDDPEESVTSQVISLRVLFGLVIGSLISTAVIGSELVYPTLDSQALWFRAFVLLALPFYLYLVVVDRRLRPNLRNPLTLAVAAFLFISLLATVFGVNPWRSFWGTYSRMSSEYHLILLTLLYFYVLLLATAGTRYLRVLLQLLVWIAALSSVYAILVALGMRGWTPDRFWADHRISSIYGNPIFFASFLILPMALALYFWRQAVTASQRYLYIALFALQGTGVVLSGTRGAMVALIAGLFLVGILFGLRRQTASHRYAAIALLCLACISVALILAAPRLPHAILLDRFAHLNDRNGSARLTLWRIAWQESLDHPALGIGPENYRAAFDHHFDQRIYEYQPAGLENDKPHNYLLEVLVTTGLGGFLTYLAMLALTLLAFSKAYRAGRISWVESVILAVGIVVYHLQNLFAFDTPCASVAFYTYTAFAAVLWNESHPQPANQPISAPVHPSPWAKVVFCIAALASIFGVVVTDGITFLTLRDIADGRLLEVTDVHAAKAYFDRAAKSVFMYDRGELGMHYQEFIYHLTTDAKEQADPAFVKSVLNSAIAVAERNVEESPNDPNQWVRLANIYFLQTRLTKTPVNPGADAAIHQAVTLAPNQIEPFLTLVQNDALGHHLEEAAAIASHAVAVAPNNSAAHWILAWIDQRQGRLDAAVLHADEALHLDSTLPVSADSEAEIDASRTPIDDMRYFPASVQELTWLIDYYADRHDDRKLAKVYERAVKVDPTDARLYASMAEAYRNSGRERRAKLATSHWLIDHYADQHDYRKLAELYENALQSNPADDQLYASLAAVYANLGEKDKARLAAEKAVRINPSLANATRAFLRSLK